MPIANVLAAVLVAVSAPSAAMLPATPPALTVAVDVAADVPPTLVTFMLAETAHIWRDAGFSLMWERRMSDRSPDRSRGASSRVDDHDPLAQVHPGAVLSGDRLVAGLRVTIGNDRGQAELDPHVLPLGWIVFEAGSPHQEIYLSFENARQLLITSDIVVGRVLTMTNRERHTLLGRAMGRALAHEIGHYLLASKAHTPTGIMQARRGAAELFSSSRRGFQLEAAQRQAITARLQALAARSHVAPPAD